VRATSAKWAWVEAVLAQGGVAEGRAVLEAVHAGGAFAAWRKAFAAIGPVGPDARRSRRKALPVVASTPE
jgi:hypothetical protein